MKEYSIEPDAVLGRIFWTDCGKQKVSTVNLKLREMDNPMVGIRNDIWAITEKFEVAVLNENGKFVCVVERTNSKKNAEKIHRQTVEAILEGKLFSDSNDITETDKTTFTSRKKLRKLAKHKGWI